MEKRKTGREEEKAYIHWLYQAVGTGGRGLYRALARLGTPEEIYGLAQREMLAKEMPERYQNKITHVIESVREYDVWDSYERMKKRGICLVTDREAVFPERLKKIPDPPCVFYYVGSLPKEAKKAVALIGARSCTAYGGFMAKGFGEALAGAGVQVISGMARGIDGIAQDAVLKAGGYSLGVLGCGVDVCYPAENRTLYEMLIARGGLFSEYPPGTPPKALLFPPRNRIISGFCDALLVIEAKERSGTLITVDMALEQGREVYALPGRATDPLSSGCNRLIRQGAGLVTSPEELLEELHCGGAGMRAAGASCVQTSLVFLDGTAGELYHLLDIHPLPTEELQRRYEEKYGSSIALPRLFKELLDLCAAGYARQVGGSYFMRVMK